jgi:hypothetical protein
VITDESGRYEITRLGAGSVVITASKEGLLPTSFGQRSWPGNGTPLTLRDGQRVDRVDIALPPGGVVTGRIFDDGGDPLVGAAVRVSRVVWLNGEVRAAPGGSDTADDRGEYRVFGLTPGRYYVSATRGNAANEGALSARGDGQAPGAASAAYAPAYYPSAASVTEAAAITVKAGQETTGIDVIVRLVPVVEVSGLIVTAEASARVTVSLLADGQLGFAPPGLRAVMSRDGTFRIPDVPPGRYLAFAQELGSGAQRAGGSDAKLRFALQPLVVAGQNVTGLSLTLGSGGTVTGSISFEATRSEPPRDLSGFRVMTTGARSSIGVPASVAQVRPDGTFAITSVPPLPMLVDAAVPSRTPDAGARSPWRLKSVYLNGQETTDTPIQVSPEQSVSGVLVVFSDSVSGLSGIVREDATPAAGCAVVVFAFDETLWRLPQSRYLRMARTDAEGHFEIHPLAPGRYYVQAVADLDPLQWTNPDVLERLRQTASVVTIGENETKSIDLVVGSR